MDILILERNQIVAKEIKKELSIIKQDAIELSLTLFIQLKEIILQFIYSFKDYSISNIKKRGLKEILWERAIRFFRLEVNEDKDKEGEAAEIKRKKGGKYWLKKTVRFILLPVYFILLFLEFLLKRKKTKPKPKIIVNKYVKNSYIE